MKRLNIFLLSIICSSLISSCTKLEEKFDDSLSAVSEEEIEPQTILQGAYNSLNGPFQSEARVFAMQEHTSDALIPPTRGGDWDDNGAWRALHTHRWTADHPNIRDTYSELLQAQFFATNVLALGSTSAQQKAEARFIRALAMYATLDGWDQVPFREGDNFNDLTILPETKKGADCASFLISELEAALPSLPDAPTTKANKNAARVLLMKLHLNMGVYKDRLNPSFDNADLSRVIALADEIINSTTPKYTLQANYFENFAPNNDALSKEIIYSLENTPGTRGGGVRTRWYSGLHYNMTPSGWNGFTTLSDYYDKFEADDKRRSQAYPGSTDVGGVRVGFLEGQQFDKNGVALKDRTGAPLAFTREVKIIESGTNLEVTGIRVMKYPIDYVNTGDIANNDYVIFRYADVLLMKAEALLRSGNEPDARALVNDIREIRGVDDFTTLTLDNLLDERARELFWEGWRRTDLVRFGKFLDAWQEKPASDPRSVLFPIPNQQIAVNPNLVQNPGY